MAESWQPGCRCGERAVFSKHTKYLLLWPFVDKDQLCV